MIARPQLTAPEAPKHYPAKAAKAKLAACRLNGDCADAALMPDEYGSDERIALAKAVAKAEGRTA